MEQTSTIYSVDTGFIYAFLSCNFPSNTKYSVLILLTYTDGKQHENKLCTAKYCRNTLS